MMSCLTLLSQCLLVHLGVVKLAVGICNSYGAINEKLPRGTHRTDCKSPTQCIFYDHNLEPIRELIFHGCMPRTPLFPRGRYVYISGVVTDLSNSKVATGL